MVKQFLLKLKESVVAVLPIVALILVIGCTPIPLFNLEGQEVGGFVFGSVMVIIGIALFNLGADMAMTPMGSEIGRGLTKKKKLGLLLLISLLIGVLVTVSEPDLSVLAKQISSLLPSESLLIIVVGVGVGLFLLVGVLKIVFKKSLSLLLMFFYLFLFALAVLACVGGKKVFLPLSFDSGGVTTGPITVPFIMALGIGIAKTLSAKDAKENSFGLIALCSAGAIVGVLLLAILVFGNEVPEFTNVAYTSTEWGKIVGHYFKELVTVHFGEVALSLGLIVAVFLVCQFTFLKLPKKDLGKLGVGILFTFFGLTLFLAAANIIYLPIGYKIGAGLSAMKPIVGILFAFVIGALVVLAEPAIAVLVNQVEDVTNGAVSKRSMLIALAIGVGAALAGSAARIYYHFDLMYIVVPGYIISLALAFFVPSIYTAIAFDSGGVASGPLTSCLILPMMIGICFENGGQNIIYQEAFGVVSLVAMIPLITIQMLGFAALVKKRRQRKLAVRSISKESDEQIIEF